VIGVDTNVLVRYIVQDDPEQSRAATSLIEGTAERGDTIFVSPPVLCELTWVLARAYRQEKEDILRVLDTLVHLRAFAFERQDLVLRALEAYRGGATGFADQLIAQYAWAADCTALATFDEALAAADPRGLRPG